MTMALVALEEIVMGSRTRQRLPCAGVNSPNHPSGTWSPDSRGEVEPLALPRLQAAGTEEPQPRQIHQGCDVFLCIKSRPLGDLHVPLPSIIFLSKTNLLKSPATCSHLLPARPLRNSFDHTHLSPPKTAVLQFNHLWMWVEVGNGVWGLG